MWKLMEILESRCWGNQEGIKNGSKLDNRQRGRRCGSDIHANGSWLCVSFEPALLLLLSN